LIRQPPARTAAVRPKDDNFRKHVSELEQRLSQLDAQVRQAQQLAGLGTAAMTIVHEVSNVLTPILAYAEAALPTDDADFKNKALTVTINNVRMAVAMADRVLAIGAAKEQRLQPVGVAATAREAELALCRDFSKDGIDFVIEADESLTVQADPLQLRQVMFNLFLNAREAMAEAHSGRVTVRAARAGEHVSIEIVDTGDGIPAEALDHIFDPLRTSKPSERAGKERCGGLGLNLCKQIVEQSGGQIGVTSQGGVGTVFSIILPVGQS
jgi:two-component system cell cycle sensor histidine kinase/response regulator CckA